MKTTPSPELIASLRAHEGLGPTIRGRTRAYRCTAGRLTIGWGHNLDARPLNSIERHATDWDGSTISLAGADWLLALDAERCLGEVFARIPWVESLDPERRDVVLEMAYQMGVGGLLEFRRTLSFVRRQQFNSAAEAMGDSLWARQTPNRAGHLIGQMVTGKYWFLTPTTITPK